MSVSANDMQIGGDHYAAEYQHWDFVREVGLDYLQGCASKYVTRARKKNGRQDLEKALHYIEKHRESPIALHGETPHWGAGSFRFNAVLRFAVANNLTVFEVAAIFYIVRGEWDAATEAINSMLAEDIPGPSASG